MKIVPCILLLLSATAFGFEWPASDADIDALLREKSAKYRTMSDAVRTRQNYRFETTQSVPLGMVAGDTDKKGLIIQLNPELKGDRRVSILIWEMVNAFQRPRFDEIDKRARDGTIASHQEFGLRMELIEYDSFRHHRDVLEDLQKSIEPIGPEFVKFLVPQATKLDDYKIPFAHDYIEAQAKSGHTRHYEKFYYVQTRTKSPF